MDDEYIAVITAVVVVATAVVVIGKLADDEPGEIVTNEGVTAAALELDKLIVTPLPVAADVMLTVPVTVVAVPPTTLMGLTVRF